MKQDTKEDNLHLTWYITQ